MVAAEQLNLSFGEAGWPELRLMPTAPSPAEQLPPHQAVRADLAFIETKLTRRIKLPSRPLTTDEEGLIGFVRTALEYGEATQRWTWVALPVNAHQARVLVDDFAGGIVRGLQLSSAVGERFVLFGAVVPLGPTHILVPQARLLNEQEVRVRLAEPTAATETFHLRFAADAVATVVFRYEDWLPGGRWQVTTTPPPQATIAADRQRIVREFPGRWRILVSEERRGLSDLLSDTVLVALEQLDYADRERILRVLPVLWGWQAAHAARWSTEQLPGADNLSLLELTPDLGLIVQPMAGGGMSVVEIVRPGVLRGYSRGR